jgi:multidrug efflux system membrane fusion protein
MKRSLEIGLLAVAALSAACAKHEAPQKPSRPVRIEKVRGEAAAGGLRYSASIQPYEQVQLAFKVGGYVRELRQVVGTDGLLRSLQQGDVVARGTVLARLNSSDYEERVNQAKAQLAEADAGLQRSRADAARAEALYEAKALTRPDYDAASAALKSSLARADAAKAQLEAAQLQFRDSALMAPATSDAYAAVEFPGRVTAVSPSADAQSRVFNIEVTIPNAERRLKAGMIASVEVGGPSPSDIPAGAPTVSVSAVVKSSKPGAFAVFVADGPDAGATARTRDVTLGRISGNRVAVSSGLQLGERVIVSGASLLIDGDRVRVIPGSEGE